MVAMQRAADLQLFLEVCLKLSIDELHDGFVAARKRREMGKEVLKSQAGPQCKTHKWRENPQVGKMLRES